MTPCHLSSSLPPSIYFHSGNWLRSFKDPTCTVAVAETDRKVVGQIYAGIVKRAENEFHQADS
jgi:hypothetical protein